MIIEKKKSNKILYIKHNSINKYFSKIQKVNSQNKNILSKIDIKLWNRTIYKAKKEKAYFKIIFILLLILFVFDLHSKSMKHSILLLSSYGIDYLNNFLSQFNIDKRFDIYIHYDKETKADIDKGKQIINSNIKYFNYKYKSPRFSLGMVKAMFELLSQAYKRGAYDYYHFFSESCYLVKPIEQFYKFFLINKGNSYVQYGLSKYFSYKNKTNILYKGSQWMTLHNSLVKEIIKRKPLFTKYIEEIQKTTNYKIRNGAYDEFIFQHIIASDICQNNPDSFKKYKVINKNLRFIRWRNCKKEYCPNFLNITNVSEKESDYIKKNFFIIRKINFKDKNAIKLINKLKYLSSF